MTDLDCIEEAGTDPAIPRGTTVPATFTSAAGAELIKRQWSRATDAVGVSQAIVDTASDRAVGLVVVTPRRQPRVAGMGN